ncbi:hypothetical protein [Saccharothrix sp. ST-888]|uniref:hypothetical protein n=1 Tax=Saccharothrix sp. ST-888 TaxID=1427391 RepID=UPI0005ED1248|nr:hypothetical protein [Saccharothrix sp. ST-888]KJK59455.1 hypothetical protein UK12_04495 [Saccharothrix sp. ST-888]
MTDGLTVHRGDAVPAMAEGLALLHRSGLGRHTPETAAELTRAFLDRLAGDAAAPGFRAVTARIDGLRCGFGAAVRTAVPAPADPVDRQPVGRILGRLIGAAAGRRARASAGDERPAPADGLGDARRLP